MWTEVSTGCPEEGYIRYARRGTKMRLLATKVGVKYQLLYSKHPPHLQVNAILPFMGQ